MSRSFALRGRTLVLVTLPAAALAVRPAGAQLSSDKYQIHGFLTQGFAKSDSLPIVGIDDKGTANYRAAALQFRFMPTAKDAAVIQVANRHMGDSPVNRLENDLTLQWAYYQRRLPASLVAKVGRAPMPRGIYNEVRKVGTVLPFYRAPYNFYTESYETIDGGMLARTTPLGAWELETSAFGGVVNFRQASRSATYAPKFAMVNGAPTMVGVTPGPDSVMLVNERAKNTLGTQFWLTTPIQGLRFGAGATRFDLNAYQNLSGRNGRSVASVVQGAVDGNFTRVQLRSEWEQFRVNEFLYTDHYVQGGVKLTSKLALNVQREQTNVHAAARPIIAGIPDDKTPRTRVAYRFGLDQAVGVNYAFRPDVIVKLEGHENTGRNYDRPVSSSGETGKYVIASMALSF